MRNDWLHYRLGKPVAGVIPQRVLVDSPFKTKLTYEVEHQCCGRIGKMTHGRIAKRLQGKQFLCWICGRKEYSSRNYPPLAIPLPLWPRPGVQK